MWLNPVVRLYTRFKPARRRKSPVRFFGPLVIVGLGIFWWLRWEPKKEERTNAPVRLTDAASSKPSASGAPKPVAGKASVSSPRLPPLFAPTNPPSLSNSIPRAAPPPSGTISELLPDARTTDSFGRATGFAPRVARNVFEMQLTLARQGISPGPFDGALGSQTRAALRAFQQRENLPVTGHDIPVDLIATPRAAIEVERAFERPAGILWDHLQPPQIHEIPVLERMGYA